MVMNVVLMSIMKRASAKCLRRKELEKRKLREAIRNMMWTRFGERKRERVEGVFYFHGKTVLRATCITFRTSHIREGLNVRLT